MSARGELVPAPRRSPARAEIEALIPHREPFLFVDELLEREVGPEGGRLSAAWTVPPEAEFFRGHYPGRPVTPGAILCEHAFQVGALYVSLALGGFSARDGVPVLARIRESRFKRVVEPGERVTTAVELEERAGPAWCLRADVRAGADLALRVRYVLTATEAMARAARGTGRP